MDFGGTNFALVHAALQGARIVPTPRLICDYARNGYMTVKEARALIITITAESPQRPAPELKTESVNDLPELLESSFDQA